MSTTGTPDDKKPASSSEIPDDIFESGDDFSLSSFEAQMGSNEEADLDSLLENFGSTDDEFSATDAELSALDTEADSDMEKLLEGLVGESEITTNNIPKLSELEDEDMILEPNIDESEITSLEMDDPFGMESSPSIEAVEASLPHDAFNTPFNEEPETLTSLINADDMDDPFGEDVIEDPFGEDVIEDPFGEEISDPFTDSEPLSNDPFDPNNTGFEADKTRIENTAPDLIDTGVNDPFTEDALAEIGEELHPEENNDALLNELEKLGALDMSVDSEEFTQMASEDLNAIEAEASFADEFNETDEISDLLEENTLEKEQATPWEPDSQLHSQEEFNAFDDNLTAEENLTSEQPIPTQESPKSNNMGLIALTVAVVGIAAGSGWYMQKIDSDLSLVKQTTVNLQDNSEGTAMMDSVQEDIVDLKSKVGKLQTRREKTIALPKQMSEQLAKNEERIGNLSNANNGLSSRLAELEQRMTSLTNIPSTPSNGKVSNKAINNLNININQLKKQVGNIEGELGNLRSSLAKNEKSLKAVKSQKNHATNIVQKPRNNPVKSITTPAVVSKKTMSTEVSKVITPTEAITKKVTPAPDLDWGVNLISLKSQRAANKLSIKLNKQGINTIIRPTLVSNQQWYRVRIEAFPNKHMAKQYINESVDTHKYTGAWVSR